MRSALPWVLVASCLAGAAARAEPPAAPAPLLDKMQKYYDHTRELYARFEQELRSVAQAPKSASGEVWLKKPGKMRWDYAKPEKKLMISDGTTLWVYEPEDEQAYRQELRGATLPAQVSFLLGEARLDKEFDIAATPLDGLAAGEVALKLVPKLGHAAYRYLVFVVDEKSGQVRQTIIYDQQGGTNRLRFVDVQQNRGIDDKKFKFAPPARTRILTAPGGL